VNAHDFEFQNCGANSNMPQFSPNHSTTFMRSIPTALLMITLIKTQNVGGRSFHRRRVKRHGIDYRNLRSGDFNKVENTILMPDLQANLTFGTTLSIDSIEGTMLAIGATERGDDFSLTPSNGNIYFMRQTGLVTWQLQSTLTGIGGSFFSTSRSFERIAVRSNQPNFVQVFSLSDLTSPRALGDVIVGSANGRDVMMSADGNHVAISSETFKLSTGMVEFFRLSSNGKWVSEGSLGGSEPGDLFGWSIAFSDDTDRIVISSLGTETVRVYEKSIYFGWIQVGQTLSSSNSGEQFGFAVDIAAKNGNTIIIGSPGNASDSTRDGKARIFDLIDNQWKKRGLTLTGNGSFGYTVKLDNEGNRVVLSQKTHSQEVYIFDWDRSAWIICESANSRPMFGGLGLAITGDGSRIVGASMTSGKNGVVELFDTPVNPSYPKGLPSEPLVVVPISSSPTAAPTAIDGVQICQCDAQQICLENYRQSEQHELFICLRSVATEHSVLDIRDLTLRQGSRVVQRIANYTKDKYTWATTLNASTIIRTRFDPSFFRRSLRGRKYQSMQIEGLIVLGAGDMLNAQFAHFGFDISLHGKKLNSRLHEKSFSVIISFCAVVLVFTISLGGAIWITKIRWDKRISRAEGVKCDDEKAIEECGTPKATETTVSVR